MDNFIQTTIQLNLHITATSPQQPLPSVSTVAVVERFDCTVDSLLTDTSVKRTLRVGPCLSLLPLFDSL